ncbi:HpcH/HpaI aldolase family protein [Aeoliella sp.]|uniref:HpcH/HpaI aldolase family protein n=1 Tax=Aeoliella sp. TaxID=2795800 RepID=UPI003CCBC2B5
MRKSRIREKLDRGEPALCTNLCLADPSVFELVSTLGFDGIWLDLEHHAHSLETAAKLFRAARVGDADIIARPGKGEFVSISRLLEAGAQAIMYPRCESPEEAREVVDAVKFAPLGKRGFDGSNADANYGASPMGSYLPHANRETVLIVQLESPEAVSQAEAMASVPGVDALMLGPADFSILSGFPGDFADPQLREALAAVATGAKSAGKAWAQTMIDPGHIPEAIAMGANIIFYGNDLGLIRQGMTKIFGMMQQHCNLATQTTVEQVSS